MTPLLFAIASAAGLAIAAADPGAAPIQAGLGPIVDLRPTQPQPPPGPAQAPASISSDIMILLGTNNNSGIDPKIGKVPELSKPPLSAYNSYKLLDRTSVSLPKAKSGSYKLPNGHELRVVYKDASAKPGEPLRFVYSASIHDPSGKLVTSTEYVAKAGDWFWLAGQDYQGGKLVMGFKINP